MDADYPVVVASFLDRDVARTFQKILIANRIEPNVSSKGRLCEVSVDAADAKRATAIYFEQKSVLSDGRASKNPRRHDYLIFGIVLGVTCCMMLLLVIWFQGVSPVRSSSNNEIVYSEDGGGKIRSIELMIWVLGVKASAILIGLFTLGGHLIDRFRMKQFKDAKLKRAVDAWEFLCLTAMPFLFFALLQTMGQLKPHLDIL
jgi:hypothetical protein